MVEPVSVDHVNQAAIAVSTLLKPNRPMRANRPSQRNAAQLAALRRLTREAKAISDWASPTSTLLSFTGDELVTSLPQLDENASDLKSFLPSRPK